MTQSEEKEFLLRGKTITLSSAIEATIARIILISNIANPKDELIKLKGIMMNEKIKVARNLLKKFHPEIYKKADPIFKRYKKLSLFRNRMAHCEFHWNDPTLLSFCVWDTIEDTKDGDYFDLVKYTVEDAFKELRLLEELIHDLGIVNELIMQAGGYARLFELLGQANPPRK